MSKITATTTDVKPFAIFQDPINKARRGRNEWEANRRWRQCLEMKVASERDITIEQARVDIKRSHPELYEHTDRMIAANPVGENAGSE